MDTQYSRFSGHKCDVIRVEFTQYASIHSNFMAFKHLRDIYTEFSVLDISKKGYCYKSDIMFI